MTRIRKHHIHPCASSFLNLLIKMYRTSVSGVFRPQSFWFRRLWQKSGQRFAVCGGNPAWQLLQVPPHLPIVSSRRQLLANAAIAASRVGSPRNLREIFCDGSKVRDPTNGRALACPPSSSQGRKGGGYNV